MNKYNISDAGTKLFHLLESQLQHTSYHQYFRIQNAEIIKTVADNIQNLTGQISTLLK